MLTTVRAFAVLLLVAQSTATSASGMSSTCAFSTAKDKSISGGAKYRIGEAYDAATLVVIGRIVDQVDGKGGKDLRLAVQLVVKGKAGAEIILGGPRCTGTACTGLSLPKNFDFVLLLREASPGVWTKVDGNGNDACPNLFEVGKDGAKIGETVVARAKLKAWLAGKPTPIAFP